MNRNRAIESQLIKAVQKGTPGSKGKQYLIDLIKEYLSGLNTPFVDDCCDATYNLPVRYNPTTDSLERYDPDTDAWVEIISNQYLMSLSLQNYEGDTDLNYPLGVFSVNNTFLGIAENTEEYITLWNSNVDNQAVGTIVSGTGTVFEVAVPYINSPNINLFGLEFYTIQSNSASPVLHVTDSDIIQIGTSTTTILGSSGVSTLSSSVNEYNGTFGVTVDNAFTFRRVTLSATVGTSINVFHSRLSEHVGMDTLTPLTYLGGVLPTSLKTFSVRTPNSVNLNTNVTNWNQITVLETFNVGNLGGNPYYIANATDIPVLPPTLIGLSLLDARPDAFPQTYSWLNAASLPNLRRLMLSANALDIVTFSATWFATMPAIDKELRITNNGGAATNAAISDIVINNTWTALSAVIPTAPATLRIEDTSSRTSASDTAYNNLVAAGWTVTLT